MVQRRERFPSLFTKFLLMGAITNRFHSFPTRRRLPQCYPPIIQILQADLFQMHFSPRFRTFSPYKHSIHNISYSSTLTVLDDPYSSRSLSYIAANCPRCVVGHSPTRMLYSIVNGYKYGENWLAMMARPSGGRHWPLSHHEV